MPLPSDLANYQSPQTQSSLPPDLANYQSAQSQIPSYVHQNPTTNPLSDLANTIGNAATLPENTWVPGTSGQSVDSNGQPIADIGEKIKPYIPAAITGGIIAAAPEFAYGTSPLDAFVGNTIAKMGLGGITQGASQVGMNAIEKQPLNTNVAGQTALGGITGGLSVPLGLMGKMTAEGLAKLGASGPAKALISALSAPEKSAEGTILPSKVADMIEKSLETGKGATEIPENINAPALQTGPLMSQPEVNSQFLEHNTAADMNQKNLLNTLETIKNSPPQTLMSTNLPQEDFQSVVGDLNNLKSEVGNTLRRQANWGNATKNAIPSLADILGQRLTGPYIEPAADNAYNATKNTVSKVRNGINKVQGFLNQ